MTEDEKDAHFTAMSGAAMKRFKSNLPGFGIRRQDNLRRIDFTFVDKQEARDWLAWNYGRVAAQAYESFKTDGTA